MFWMDTDISLEKNVSRSYVNSGRACRLICINDQETSFEQEQRIRIEPLMVPSAPQEYQEHLKNVKMQLDICELSLKRRKEK
mgnify:CR=1 FL=1